jgi:hypothetical protein
MCLLRYVSASALRPSLDIILSLVKTRLLAFVRPRFLIWNVLEYHI